MSNASHTSPISRNNTGSHISLDIESKKCHHGVDADVFTSMTDDHPAMRFYRCSLRKKNKDCGYFVWIDPDLSPFQRGCFVTLKAQKIILEEKLKRSDAVEKLLNERLDLKIDELRRMEELQKKLLIDLEKQALTNEELQSKFEAAENRSEASEQTKNLLITMVVVLVLFVVLAYV